jgi:hypothetical protein
VPKNCRLCGSQDKLRKSHIIPEFLYASLYDEIHGATGASTSPTQRNLIQKGLREYLLCTTCEGTLGEVERRVAEGWDFPKVLHNDTYCLTTSCYTDLKLFLLSVLWRASVSSLPEFRGVSLGSQEEELRCLLVNREPGPSTHFPISGRLLAWPDDRALCDWLITSPSGVHYPHFDGWLFIFGGLAWVCVPGFRRLALGPGGLLEAGGWTLPVVNFSSFEAVRTWFRA